MDGNLAMANSIVDQKEHDFEPDVNPILEAAYLIGFEPSSDYITEQVEIQEAIEFLTIKDLLS